MPTRNVFLTEHLDTFIAAGIERGRYSNASEVVRVALRLLEQREAEDRGPGPKAASQNNALAVAH